MSSNNLKTVAVYSKDWEAHIAVGVLEQAGIRSVIDNEVMSAVLPIGFNSIGGVRLLVNEADYENARKALDHSSSSGS